MKTVAELEAENADLRARLARAERMVDRLLAEPPKVEVHREVVKQFVPYPAPMPVPAPIYPSPWVPAQPPWIPNPWDWQYGGTFVTDRIVPGANVGCVPMMPTYQVTVGETVWNGAAPGAGSWH